MERRSFLQQCSLLPLVPFVSTSAGTALTGSLKPKGKYAFDGTMSDFELIVGKDLSRSLSESKQNAETFFSSIRVHRQILNSRKIDMPRIWIHDRRRNPHERQYLILVLGAVVHAGTLATDFPTTGEVAQKETDRQLFRIADELACVAQEHQSIWHACHHPVHVYPLGKLTN